MKKFLFVLAGIAALTFASCSKIVTPEDPEDDPAESQGVFILNNGNWGDNDANVGIYYPADKRYSADVFGSANGKGLGDLGQDIMTYGEDVYIAVNGSKLIFVCDRELNIKRSITASAEDNVLSPRYLCSGGGKVYVSYYEGYLGEIDPLTYELRTTPVGPNPEGIAYSDGSIYVANSGGYLYPAYNNTLSVVDADDFTESRTINVNTNPCGVVAYGGKIYVSSLGNYGSVPAMVQVIEGNELRELAIDSPSAIALSGSTLYVLCGGYDENWNQLPGSVIAYDCNTGESSRIISGVENAYSLAVSDNYIWVGCSDYKNNGDFRVYTLEGELYDSFDTQGLNPQAIAY